MPDASERIRADVKPVAPLRRGAFARALRRSDRRMIAGAALAAMMIGIVVNAVALQHGRRVDLGPDPAPVAALAPIVAKPAPAAKPAKVAEPVKVAEAVPEPPQPPSPPATRTKPPDAIADFLRATPADKHKLTLAAQGALAKLGFDVKRNGALDADTRDALREFEKSRHMAASTEITPKLVAKLKAAAAAK